MSVRKNKINKKVVSMNIKSDFNRGKIVKKPGLAACWNKV